MKTGETKLVAGSYLEWDSNFFGVRVGIVNGLLLTEASLADILQWCATERIRCLYFSADGRSPETLALAFLGGFQFVDVRLDLEYRLAPLSLPNVQPGKIRVAQHSDLTALQQIARVSHYDTRFFKDRFFTSKRAEDLYAEWIRRDLQMHTVFVADCASTAGPVGYITCQVDSVSKTGRIGLLAVDGRFTGQGIGGALVRAAHTWFSTQGCTAIKVATQASNIPAQRLYQAAGFRTLNSIIWFHRWFPTPTP